MYFAEGLKEDYLKFKSLTLAERLRVSRLK